MQDLINSRAQIGRYVSDSLAATGVFRALADYHRTLPQFRLALPAMEALSRLALGDSMISANLDAKWASIQVHQLTDAIMPALQALTRDQIRIVTQISSLLEHHNALLAGLRPAIEVARPVVLATRAWQDAVRVAPRDQTGRYLERLTIAGRGTGWAVQAGVALTEKDDARVAELEVEASVALGPAAASAELRMRLAAVDPSLCERLDGAWERIQLGGANASSQAAHSLMEAIDWTLRLSAPDDGALAWHAVENRSSKELNNGRPTRALRLRYVVRDHPEKNSTVNLYLKAIQELVGIIQGPKHELHPPSAKALTSVALTVEGLLHFILVD